MVINDSQPEYCVERAMHILNRHKKAINGSKILVLGVAYKQDIDDYRESPALAVIDELNKVGACVEYYDPWVSAYKRHGNVYYSIKKFTGDIVAGFDLILITCAHTNVNYKMVQKNAKAIFDTKNIMKDLENRENIEVL
jgi:UDP-N-acetyl-D-glucosamine dehydrogenase